MTLMTKKEILEDAQAQEVKYVRLCFTDIHGIIKNVEIPVDGLPEALENKTMFDGSSVDGFSRIDETDMYLYPDLNTWLVLPWENTVYGNVARLICDVHLPDGTPFIGDSRVRLKQNLAYMESMGFKRMKVGVEPEFFLFKQDEKGDVTLTFNDRGGYFDLGPVDEGEDCRRDIVLELQKLGFTMEASHHEVSPSQHEINFEFDDALEAADKLQTFKLVVRNVAKRHNLHATFMPKPIEGVNGSGMHTNCSLTDKDDNNVFYDPEGENGLSNTAKQWIGGIMAHARGFTAITNPIVNSYKRLIPGFEAPTYISWSDNNRSVMIRVPNVMGKKTRTEIRSVDPTANPYLAFSVILRSGLDGIEKNLNDTKPIRMNLYALTRDAREEMGIKNLPGSLKDALKELRKDELIKEALGPHIYDRFISAKFAEWDDYKTRVSKWERDQYLKTF
ncbi:MAG: glutamine synthetase family protein [Bacillota bacterium]